MLARAGSLFGAKVGGGHGAAARPESNRGGCDRCSNRSKSSGRVLLNRRKGFREQLPVFEMRCAPLQTSF